MLHEDLPRLLDAVADPVALESEWRTHFHVPIHQTRFGHLSSTQDDILTLLAACRRHSEVQHFEVETYAWSVLPPALRPARLADGIADEMRLVQARSGRRNCRDATPGTSLRVPGSRRVACHFTYGLFTSTRNASGTIPTSDRHSSDHFHSCIRVNIGKFVRLKCSGVTVTKHSASAKTSLSGWGSSHL